MYRRKREDDEIPLWVILCFLMFLLAIVLIMAGCLGGIHIDPINDMKHLGA